MGLVQPSPLSLSGSQASHLAVQPSVAPIPKAQHGRQNSSHHICNPGSGKKERERKIDSLLLRVLGKHQFFFFLFFFTIFLMFVYF